MNVLERHRVREMAFDCWEQSGHDFAKAQELFHASQPVGISPMLLAALVELAIKWFMHFQNEAQLMGVGLETD